MRRENMENDNNQQPQQNYQQQPPQQQYYQQPPQQPYQPEKPKKSILKKWWFWVIIIVVLLFGYMIFSGGDGESTNGDADPSNGASNNASVDDKKDDDSNTLGKYNVEIKSAKLAKDYDDSDCIIITYEWSHEYSESFSFSGSFDDKLFQNGVECERAYFADENENASKDIKSGVTLEVTRAYSLNDTTTPVEVEVSEYFSFSSKKVTKTFDLK